MHLVEHWAQRTEDHAIASGSQLASIAGCEQAGGAVQRMRRLAACSPVIFLDPSSDQDAAKLPASWAQGLGKLRASRVKLWVLGLPNFAKKQGFTESIRSGTGVSDSATATASVREERKTPSGSPGPAPRDRARPWGKLRNLLPADAPDAEAWLAESFDAIQADVELEVSRSPRGADRKAVRSAAWKSVTLRRWNAYRRWRKDHPEDDGPGREAHYANLRRLEERIR